jgi:hypothetical protein
MIKKLLRFHHLKERNVVKSWAQLKRLQDLYGFPQGRMLSPNVRTWTEEEIDTWVDSRPVAGPVPRGGAKRKRDRKRADEAATAT